MSAAVCRQQVREVPLRGAPEHSHSLGLPGGFPEAMQQYHGIRQWCAHAQLAQGMALSPVRVHILRSLCHFPEILRRTFNFCNRIT